MPGPGRVGKVYDARIAWNCRPIPVYIMLYRAPAGELASSGAPIGDVIVMHTLGVISLPTWLYRPIVDGSDAIPRD